MRFVGEYVIGVVTGLKAILEKDETTALIRINTMGEHECYINNSGLDKKKRRSSPASSAEIVVHRQATIDSRQDEDP